MSQISTVETVPGSARNQLPWTVLFGTTYEKIKLLWAARSHKQFQTLAAMEKKRKDIVNTHRWEGLALVMPAIIVRPS